jgi:sec-independent protein translocase protein TatA
MIGDLFDNPWKVLIFAVVILVLFGSKKLPDAARSLGRSMRILKAEVTGLHDDEPNPTTSGTQAQAAPAASETPFPQAQLTAAPVPADQQSQIDVLQQQIRDLQRAATIDASARAGVASEPPQSG